MLGVGEKVSSAVPGMTVQDAEARVMPQTASTRSRFMITDILSGPADGTAIIRGRSPSPGPRDLSLHSNPIHDSDTDSSGHPDTSSVCSNGKCTSDSLIHRSHNKKYFWKLFGKTLRTLVNGRLISSNVFNC